MEDIIIIGGGPVGIYASTLASLHNLKGILIESLDTLGGQLTSLYPQKSIIDLPGFNSVTAKEFIDKLNEQRLSKGNSLDIHLQERVIDIIKQDTYYQVITNKEKYFTKTILIASGMGVFKPRLTGLDNESQFNNIIYSLKSFDKYYDKEIAVLGGGDSAVDWALTLSKIAKRVYIIHRRDEFRAQSASVDKLISNSVEVIKPYNVIEFIGDEQVNTIRLKHVINQEIKEIHIDFVFVNYGIITSPVEFNVDKINNLIKVDTTYMTSQENIFAIGNAITYPGKVNNITAGLGEAVIAINKIDQIINPNKNIPIHF